MEDIDKNDAIATVKFALMMAIVDTAHITGLRPGNPVDALVDELYFNLLKDDIRWALHGVMENANRNGTR